MKSGNLSLLLESLYTKIAFSILIIRLKNDPYLVLNLSSEYFGQIVLKVLEIRCHR